MPAAARAPIPRPVASALELIGATPLLELNGLDAGPCRLFAKLESANPGGSIKDRIAVTMIEAAERDGRLKLGGVIVEATAGNTGLGLAQVGVLKGYRLILVVPDKMAREKIQHLRGLGVDVRLTRSDVLHGHPDYYMDMAERIAADTPSAVYINQFANPANPLAHEQTTGPELWEQMDHDIDAVVVGVGSGGTLTGLGRYFARVSPKTRMILADPVGSALAPMVNHTEIRHGSWVVEGIGQDDAPPNCDLSLVSKAYSIPDRESLDAVHDLLRVCGVLGGSSSGTLLAAALRWCREQDEPRRVATLVCDSGNKYLSKVFNAYWLADQGLADRPMHGDLRDLIARRYGEGGAVTVGPEDSLLTAYNRMRSADVSQVPVLKDGRLVGILDESDLLFAVEHESERDARFQDPVYTAMTTRLNTLQARERLDALLPLFEREEVALVMDGREYLGLITRVDLINHLRRA